MKKIGFVFCWCCCCLQLSAQLWNGQDTLFGNEWVHFDQPYFKIKIDQNGVYRIPFEVLKKVGLKDFTGSRFQLLFEGKEVPLFVSSADASLQEKDFIEFYGRRNAGGFDRFLYENPDRDQLNPLYALYSDTSVYFLSVAPIGMSTLRYANLAPDQSNVPSQAISWCWRSTQTVFQQAFTDARYDGENLITYSSYDTGEGFGSGYARQRQIDFKLDQLNSSIRADASLEIRLFSNSAYQHQLSIRTRQKNAPQSLEQLEILDSLDRFTVKTYQRKLVNTALSDQMSVQIDGNIDNSDQYSIAFVQWRYPANLSLGQNTSLLFELDPSNETRFFELKDLPLNSQWVLYDRTNQYRILPKTDQRSARFVLPASNQNTAYFLFQTPKTVQTIEALTPVTFRDYRSIQADFILITHPRLIQHPEGKRNIDAYLDYRRSLEGGGFTPLLLSVDELYLQFGYGHTEHPQGLRNFGFWLKKQQTKTPFIFLVGHGMDYVRMRRDQGVLRPHHFIPPFGVPGSDRLLFTPNGKTAPLFPIGRLAVTEPEQIKNYLNKVISHERRLREDRDWDQAAWQKKVLHIVGGNPGDQALFKNHVERLSQTIAQNGFGAQVTTVIKENAATVQRSTAEEVIQSVNAGVAIKTFFGHGAVTNTDFGLDDPSIFDNKDRYPVMFSLGCLTGYLYDQQNSLSERFVLTPERGAIAYVASAGYAYPSALETYLKTWYDLLGDPSYCTQSLGTLLQLTCQKLEIQALKSFGLRSLLEQISYHGDPALVLRRYNLPDLTFDPSSIQLSPGLPHVYDDSITLSGSMANIGFNYLDSVELAIRRVLPGGMEQAFRKKIRLRGFSTPWQTKIPTQGNAASGLNTLYLEIDPENRLVEAPLPSAKNNNQFRQASGKLGLSFVVQANDFAALSPADESIVTSHSQMVRLSIGASNPASTGIFQMEIDTLRTFDSSYKLSTTVTMSGGRADWTLPPSIWRAGLVYYWRAKPDSAQSFSAFKTYSFKYGGNHKGWNQSHHQQFPFNRFQQTEWSSAEKDLHFQTKLNNIIGESIAMGSANSVPTRYLYNNHRVFRVPFWWGWGKALCIAVFDPLTGQPWLNTPGGKYGAYNLERTDLSAFVFRLETPLERQKIIQFLEQVIPSGHYVLLLTHHDEGQSFFADQWAADSLTYGKNLFQVLEKNGAQLIRQLEKRSATPYIFSYINHGKVLGEALANSNAETRTLWFDLPETLTKGSMSPQLIGPARRWESLHWNYQIDGPADQVNWQIYALGVDGQTKIPVWEGAVLGDSLDLTGIDAQLYPWLSWEAKFQDSILRTPAKLHDWQAYYSGWGDAALRLGNKWGWLKDTVQQGESLQLRTPIYNFGEGALDSLEVQFTLIDQYNNSSISRQKLGRIAQNDSLLLRQSWDTRQLEGTCRLIIELNPGKRTLERYYWNNVGTLAACVQVDKSPPVVDVTFDGVRILNNDLVSSKPLIAIQVSDENRFLPLQDTSLLDVRIVPARGNTLKPIFQQMDTRFLPASGEKNSARLEWMPSIETDGEYVLQVRARDASGNLAGNSVYSIRFRIVREAALSQFLPYPNPFTSTCRFWYTLSGEEALDNFQIQIFTISGKQVRHISSAEFGPLKVGVHLSDFVWDGTDDFGDRLANGVYLYRVNAQNSQGQALKVWASAADAFVKNGFGKIVLLR
jgi:hypothetical protein